MYAREACFQCCICVEIQFVFLQSRTIDGLSGMMTPHNLIVSHSVSNCQALCQADCQDIGTRLALLHRGGGDGEDSDGDGGDGDDDDGDEDDGGCPQWSFFRHFLRLLNFQL